MAPVKKLFLSFLLSLFLISSACKFSNPDTTNNEINNDLVTIAGQSNALIPFDSIIINNFFQLHSISVNYKQDFTSFYRKRNYVFGWINNSGINEYGRNFLNLLKHEERISRDQCILYPDQLEALFNMISDWQGPLKAADSEVAELDFLLTLNFFAYANRNWQGINEEEVKKVKWFIERKQLKLDDLLDSMLEGDPLKFPFYKPVYRQYELLKDYLQKYYEMENQQGNTWRLTTNELKKGDTSSIIPSIKKQLYLFEDLKVNDSSNVFDQELENAVKEFQLRHGLKDDGIISGLTFQAMRVPIHERIEQLLINMERSKWVPAEQKGDYLVVNIPAFKLFVYNNDSLEWSCNVIVGKSKSTNNTVIFNDDLEYIVFNPYWNIPRNILLKETLPEIKKDPDYLLKHDMEVVDESGRFISSSALDWNSYTDYFPYIIRQKPGKNNSLGLVKFLFPNSYDIYMHDTPEKSLFGETTRTFSHGCIRLEEPYRLARYLLRDDSSWSEEKINSLLSGGQQTFVKLKKKVPVFIAYFTAWVDRDGKLNFREDIYNHDAKMKKLLFPDN